MNERRTRFEEEALPHLDAVYRFALRLSGSAAEAEDLVQDTFLRAFKSREQYTAGTRGRSWLFTISRNVFFRQRERARRHDEIVEHAARHHIHSLTRETPVFAAEVPVGTIKSRLFRGRRLLRKQLRDYATEMGYVQPKVSGG